MLSNVTVIANRMQFEDGHDGRLVGFKDPLLTSVSATPPFPTTTTTTTIIITTTTTTIIITTTTTTTTTTS
jgi:hypothetical protein